MKDTIGLLLVSVIPAILGILILSIEFMYPGNLYALKGIGVLLGYMFLVAAPIAFVLVGKGDVEYHKLPTWL